MKRVETGGNVEADTKPETPRALRSVFALYHRNALRSESSRAKREPWGPMKQSNTDPTNAGVPQNRDPASVSASPASPALPRGPLANTTPTPRSSPASPSSRSASRSSSASAGAGPSSRSSTNPGTGRLSTNPSTGPLSSRNTVSNATVPGVAPQGAGAREPMVLPSVLLPHLANVQEAALSEAPFSDSATPPTKKMSPRELALAVAGAGGEDPRTANATVPGLGAATPGRVAGGRARVNNTEPLPLPLPLPLDPGATERGMPPSDPFVENAITAPITPKSGAPSPGAAAKLVEPPATPEDLIRGLERDRSVQAPVAHVAESRGRDGASHAAIVQPAPGHVEGPAEPLVVVDVGTDPTAHSVSSLGALPPAVSDVPHGVPRAKSSVVLMLCIFGACLFLAVGIIGTLVAKYVGPNPASPSASPVSSGAVVVKPASRAPAASVPSSLATPPLDTAAPAPPAASSPAASPPPAAAETEEPSVAAPSGRPASTHTSGSHGPAKSPNAPAQPGNVRHAGELERGVD